MTHSLAQTTELTCPRCEHTFTADVWLIVDAAERPDLLERARVGTLHDLPCPHCGHRGAVDAPLLLLRPGQEPPLLFSPAQRTTAEQDREQAARLVGALRERLGDTWQDEWVKQGLPGVQRPMLPVALSDDPEVALRQAAEQARQELERLQEEDPEAYRRLEKAARQALETTPLLQALQGFLQARTWDTSRRILEQHPELLTDETHDLLRQLMEAQEDRDTLRYLEERRALLRRCREVGIEAAFAEHVGMQRTTGVGVLIPAEFETEVRLAQEAEGRYLRTGNPAALDEAAAAWERILGHAAFAAAPERFQLAALNNSGGVFLRRYWAQGRVDDLNRVLGCWQQAMQRTPPDSPDLPALLNNLGLGLCDRYARTGQLADLEEAIRVYRQAVQRSPPDPPALPSPLTNLGLALRHHYVRTGQLADLEEAIRVHQQAVGRTPPDSPDLPGYLTNLGAGLRDRYARTGELVDLEEAIRVYQQAMQRTPPDSPDLPMHLTNLGLGLRDRYARTGEWADLEQAIRVYQQAVQRTPPDSPDLPGYLNNLGTGLSVRYARTGELADLEEAIRVYRQAVQRTPPDSPDLPGRLNNLGSGLSARYARTGELADLEEAIRVYQQAAQRTPPDSPDLPAHLTNLGNGLSERYARTGELADLEEAIRVYRQAVQRTPPDSPDLPQHLSNLGGGLSARYARSGQMADLEEAVRVFQQAVGRTPPDSPGLPARLNNLGTGLSARYARSGQMTDLEEAIGVHQQAVQHTPPDSPDLPALLNNLGTGLRERHARTGQWADLEEAIGTYERALTVLDRAFLLSPVAYQLGQQGRWAGLTAHAVEVHHQAGRAAQALAITEGNKSRLLTTLLGRGQIPAPATIPGDLAERERTLVAALVDLDAADLARHGSGAAEGSTLPRRQALVAQLMSLWEEMKGHGPEASDYVALRQGDRPDWEALARLATDLGPKTALVSLFTTGENTLLFVLRAGMEAPQAVEIPLDGAGWQDLLRRFLREVHFYDGTDHRAETWPTSLIPLLQKATPHLEGARWVVLAPHAGGHLLPWDALARRAGWAVAPVTTPALGVLARVLSHPAGERTGALVVGNPLGDLPYAEAEAQQVANGLGVFPLLRQHATRAAVLQQLEQAGLAHFATHAYYAPGSPLDSGIVLADGILTAREILERGLRAPEFLALSACQTGMAGALGGDEIAGLSQALVYAGARSLLVSLWTVNDPATAHLMAGFYRGWREQGLDKATALRDAMDATRSARPAWAHTYYWGAFTLVGDWR